MVSPPSSSCVSIGYVLIDRAVFNDFCDWAGNGMELWTDQTYYTGDYYCAAGAPICIHLLITYMCGDGSAYPLDYNGCMVSYDCVVIRIVS